jgi:uncharacterized protein
MHTHGVIHFEIHATDPERTVKFYSDIFGWEIKKWVGGDFEYWMVMTGPENTPGSINGGIVRRKGPAPADGAPVSAYVCTIGVNSVDETMDKVIAAGGKEALPKFMIADMAWQAYCHDPEGNIFGIHEPIKK